MSDLIEMARLQAENERLREAIKEARRIIHEPQTLSGSDVPSTIAQNRMIEIYRILGEALQ